MTTLDLVLYGATGFTGRLAARYLTAHAPAGLRWAVAGRDAARLDALRRELVGPAPPAEAITAQAGAPESIAAMVRATRAVASTAGPFARFSDPVVSACVEAGVDYCDITGETPWVARLIERDHARAEARGTRVVPGCGFDSVPSDLGAWMVVDWARRTWGQATPRVGASFLISGGGLNGGTLASALGMAERGEAAALDDPLLLVPPSARERVAGRLRKEAGRHPDLEGWLAPFVMAPINTQVVLRSAALWAERGSPYAPRFHYEEAWEQSRPLSARLAAAGLRLADRALRSSLGRAVAKKLGPAPGDSPSEAAMERGFFRTRLVGHAADGRKALGVVSYPGDAGNRSTVLLLCESALALALDRERLPGGGGVLPPALALGPVLVERLTRAGVRLSVEPLPSS